MEERGQMAEALSPKLLRAGIERAIARFNLGEGLALNAQERAILADDVQDEIAGLGPLEPLLREYREVEVIGRSEEHTSELQSLMRNSYAVLCLKKNKATNAI